MSSFDDGRVVQVSLNAGEPSERTALGTVIGISDDSKYSIATFEDEVVDVTKDALKEVERLSGREGGFDAVYPISLEGVEAFQQEVVGKLQEQNFCIVQMRMSPDIRRTASNAAMSVEEWSSLASEFQHDYLGREIQDKSKWFNPDEELSQELLYCDMQLEDLVGLLSASSEELGFSAAPRSNTMLRVAARDEEDMAIVADGLQENMVMDASVINQQLSFIDRRRLSVIMFVTGESGEIELIDLTTQSRDVIKVPVEENRALVFRHDLFDYRRQANPGDLALQAWILRQALPHEPSLEERTPMTVQVPAMGAVPQLSRAPVYGDTGERVEVVSCATFQGGNDRGPSCYWALLSSGTDGITDVPLTRWDHSLYWAPENDALNFKGYCRHTCFTDTTELSAFDAEFFKMSPAAAVKIDPICRKGLEVGYEALHRAGWTKATLNGAKMGVAIGSVPGEVYQMNFSAGLVGVTVDGEMHRLNSPMAVSSRLSFTLGVLGPSYSIDTACSSSLSAVGMVHTTMRPEEPGRRGNCSGTDRMPSGLAMGMNSQMSPNGIVSFSNGSMMTHQGRCFTFDQTADGYVRSEGVSALHAKVSLNPNGDPLRLAMLCGTSANQDGKSASLTAPNGPSQQEAIRQSLAEAKIPSLDIQIQELHGTGTALGDPIEIGALRAVMIEDKIDGQWVTRQHPLVKTSGKSNIGHMELNAGLGGLIKCVLMSCHACAVPNVHLRELNSHVDKAGYPVLFTSEIVDQGAPAGYFGVSSFGFSGCNARADIWGNAIAGTLSDSTLPLDTTNARCKFLEFELARSLQTQEKYLDGAYLVGDPMRSISGGLQISGSFNGRATFEDMYVVTDMDADVQGGPEEKWSYLVRLGETRVEYFRLNTNLGEIFPRDADAGPESRVLGPGNPPVPCQWRIDARDRPGVAVGSYFKVLYWYDPDITAKRVTWELATPVEEEEARENGWLPPAPAAAYSIAGTFTTGRPLAMQVAPGKPQTESSVAFEYTVRIGLSGREDFQILRQGDPAQTIYPQVHAPDPQEDGADVAACGPDSQADGRFWRLRGQTGDKISILIEVNDGHIRVTTTSLGPGSAGYTNAWTSRIEPRLSLEAK